jgi:hypothetical protein
VEIVRDQEMKRRGRRANLTPSVRMRLGEGNIQLGQDKDMDALYQRLQELPRGTRFRTVCAWLITGAKMAGCGRYHSQFRGLNFFP